MQLPWGNPSTERASKEDEQPRRAALYARVSTGEDRQTPETQLRALHAGLVNALKEFQALGVDFISHQEQIDTTTPQGEMVFGFMASLAQFESSLISERVKAGMQRAKEEGKHVGRPPIPEDTQVKIRELKEEGVSINQIAERLDIAYGTAWNYVQEVKNG